MPEEGWGVATGRRDDERTISVPNGTIATITDRGFGFIQREGGQGDVFFHMSSVEGGGFDALREGQRVTFEEEPDPRDSRRMRAVRVVPLDPDSDR